MENKKRQGNENVQQHNRNALQFRMHTTVLHLSNRISPSCNLTVKYRKTGEYNMSKMSLCHQYSILCSILNSQEKCHVSVGSNVCSQAKNKFLDTQVKMFMKVIIFFGSTVCVVLLACFTSSCSSSLIWYFAHLLR